MDFQITQLQTNESIAGIHPPSNYLSLEALGLSLLDQDPLNLLQTNHLELTLPFAVNTNPFPTSLEEK